MNVRTKTRFPIGVVLALVCVTATLYAASGQAAPRSGVGHHAGAATGIRPPHNGRIFFSTGFVLPDPDLSGNWQVYSVRPNGSHLRQLTHVPDGSQAGDPSVSPDGRTVAYVSNQSGQFGVWLMNRHGRHQHLVLQRPHTNYYTPSWAPSGKRLVVSACNDQFGFEAWCDLVSLHPDGTHLHMLLADHRFDFYAQYSPNGRRIEFTSDRGGILGAIWVMPATGGKPRRVTPARLEASVATWTPDGRHLVTGTHCCEAGGNLYRIGIDGHHLVRLTSAAWPRGAGGPAYSPDGRRLAFNSNLARSADSPDIDLFTMRPDGTHVRRIEKAVQPIVVISWGRVPAPARTERAAR